MNLSWNLNCDLYRAVINQCAFIIFLTLKALKGIIYNNDLRNVYPVVVGYWLFHQLSSSLWVQSRVTSLKIVVIAALYKQASLHRESVIAIMPWITEFSQYWPSNVYANGSGCWTVKKYYYIVLRVVTRYCNVFSRVFGKVPLLGFFFLFLI